MSSILNDLPNVVANCLERDSYFDDDVFHLGHHHHDRDPHCEASRFDERVRPAHRRRCDPDKTTHK